MATDATITATSKDLFTGSAWMIPAGVLLAGTYLWHTGSQPRSRGVSENDMSTGMLVTAGGLAAAVLWWLSSRSKTPINTIQGLPAYQGPVSSR